MSEQLGDKWVTASIPSVLWTAWNGSIVGMAYVCYGLAVTRSLLPGSWMCVSGPWSGRLCVAARAWRVAVGEAGFAAPSGLGALTALGARGAVREP